MAAKVIEVPDFDYSAFYYPQILEALFKYKRANIPELTDESEFEPTVQLMRMMALVGHLNNVLADLIANESTIVTAKLVDSVRNMLRNIDYKLSPATPANVELVYELARVFNSNYTIIPEGAQASTQRQSDSNPVIFEAASSLSISRTDQFGLVMSNHASEFGVYMITEMANSPGGPAAEIWPGVNQIVIGSCLTFGHPSVMWDKIMITLGNLGAGFTGVWEYYDGDFSKGQPSNVLRQGVSLRVDLNSILGTSPRPLTHIRVTLNTNGAYEEAYSGWDGTTNYVLVGFIGQASPSLDVSDYTIGSDWSELPNLIDGTAGLTKSGDVEFSLPQDISRRWSKATRASSSYAYTAYYVRFRITSTTLPVNPSIVQARMDTGKQYVIAQATQGQLASDDPLGSSTGLPDQRFVTSRDFFIVGTMKIKVDNEDWKEVDNFFESNAVDKHFVVELGANDRATIVFGSGVQGKVPNIGVNNIVAEYRYGANEDGNVGPNTVIVDKTGLTFVNSIFNPRQASGWQEAEGSTKASLQRAKVAGPASIRVRESAISPTDAAWMVTKKYTTADGSIPFERALPIEEGLGPKTVELVLVKKGGGLANNDELNNVNVFFNGDSKASPPLPKRFVSNQEVYAFNYAQRIINIEAIVYATGVTAQEIENNLRKVIQPNALREDGVTYEWEFGDEVPRSRLIHEIFATEESKTTNVVLLQPNADIILGKRELPVPGTITITVLEPK